MNLPLTRFSLADAPALLDLSESIGWKHPIEVWETALASGIVAGHRDADGRIASSAAIFLYGSGFASIGLVIVRAGYRRSGLARAAMHALLAEAAGRAVMLVATPDGEPLYLSLGFRTVETVHNLIAKAGTSLPASDCRSATDSDLATALQLDREVLAADRSVLLAHRWKQGAGGAMLATGDGFAWKAMQRDLLVIGPVIAPDARAAAGLVGHLAAGHEGRVRINVPGRQAEFIGVLLAAGFDRMNERPLMVLNGNGLPGRREDWFALATLAFG